MATQLSVNLNKIALLRNARGREYPSVVDFATMVLQSEAVGVTMHPRPDERHATKKDIYALAELLIDYPGKELNIEGNPTDDFLDLVLDVKPHQCTLVPDDPNQITSDHGWDLDKDLAFVKSRVSQLKESGIRTSIFMDPVVSNMQLAHQTGTDRIELYTESYAESYSGEANEKVLQHYKQTAQAAHSLDIAVNAGHDLNLDNLETFLVEIDDVKEVSIGHALIVESLLYGFELTLNNYLDIVKRVNKDRL